MKRHMRFHKDGRYATSICYTDSWKGDHWKEDIPERFTEEDNMVTCKRCLKIRGRL